MQFYKNPTSKFKYVFDFPFDYEILAHCRSIKFFVGIGGFKFHEGKWRFNDLSIINFVLEKYPEATVHVNMYEDMLLHEANKEGERVREERAIKLKTAKDSDIFINGLKNELYPYQKVGVEFIDNNDGKAIIADSMGVGKSAQALGYIVYKNLKKSLIICPASVKYSWEMEVKKWTKLKSYVVDGRSPLTQEAVKENDIVIINYDIIKKYLDDLMSYSWEIVVLDEFQMVKNSGASRTKSTKKIASKIKHVILLSGTPMLNRPVELFNGLNLMDPNTWNDYFSYTSRYCKGHQGVWGWEAKGASNIKELQERINKYFIRRTKEDVLKDLPPKQHIKSPVELDKEWMEKYTFAENSFIEYLREVKQKIVPEEGLSATKLVKMNELRQITSNGKIWAARELIENILESGENVLVFSVYNEPLNLLYEHFGSEKSVMITGKTKGEDRRDIVDRFQNDKKTKIFFGGIKSAGVGITLTKATNVVFLDYSWTPADHSQAEDRIHRIGQEADSVSIYQLYSKGTIDEEMTRILEGKQKLFDQIIDGKELGTAKNRVSLFDDVIKALESKGKLLTSI